MSALKTLEYLISEHKKIVKGLDLALRDQKIALEITIKDFNKELKNNPPPTLITLESKKGDFNINKYIVFLDNGACIQVLPKSLYGGQGHLPFYFKSVISKANMKKIDKVLDRKVVKGSRKECEGLTYFTLIPKSS